MKIFLGAYFDGKRYARINADDSKGNYIILFGHQPDIYSPVRGIQLNDGEDERLKKWLHDINLAKLIEENL